MHAPVLHQLYAAWMYYDFFKFKSNFIWNFLVICFYTALKFLCLFWLDNVQYENKFYVKWLVTAYCRAQKRQIFILKKTNLEIKQNPPKIAFLNEASVEDHLVKISYRQDINFKSIFPPPINRSHLSNEIAWQLSS